MTEDNLREIGAMTEVNIPKEDDESNGKHIALLMLAQHPSLHKPNTPERVVTEHVNGLLRHMLFGTAVRFQRPGHSPRGQGRGAGEKGPPRLPA